MALSLQRGIAITVEAEVLVKRDATRDVSDIILFSGDWRGEAEGRRGGDSNNGTSHSGPTY